MTTAPSAPDAHPSRHIVLDPGAPGPPQASRESPECYIRGPDDVDRGDPERRGGQGASRPAPHMRARCVRMCELIAAEPARTEWARTRARPTRAVLVKRIAPTLLLVARLESGRVCPSNWTLEKVARATGTRLRIHFDSGNGENSNVDCRRSVAQKHRARGNTACIQEERIRK